MARGMVRSSKAHVHGEVPARAGPSVAADDEDLLLGLAVLVRVRVRVRVRR